jgi:hypothetical protein
MNNDSQIINHLWWLRKFLNNHFGDKEYKDIIREELDTDTCRELDDLVQHIKLNYYKPMTEERQLAKHLAELAHFYLMTKRCQEPLDGDDTKEISVMFRGELDNLNANL